MTSMVAICLSLSQAQAAKSLTAGAGRLLGHPCPKRPQGEALSSRHENQHDIAKFPVQPCTRCDTSDRRTSSAPCGRTRHEASVSSQYVRSTIVSPGPRNWMAISLWQTSSCSQPLAALSSNNTAWSSSQKPVSCSKTCVLSRCSGRPMARSAGASSEPMEPKIWVRIGRAGLGELSRLLSSLSSNTAARSSCLSGRLQICAEPSRPSRHSRT
mmetsp:Transcript_95573/g.309649  ORF Transcript_95573/g.309649 Transcript_95573/m.309649 type:complete len:213 (-) Transcript_95573:83-721(-)